MTSHRIAVAASMLLLLGVPRARAREALEAHTTHAPKTIVLDTERLQPSDLEMTPSDAVVFENQSIQPITVTFTEPADLAERIRCGLVRKDPKEKTEAPWQLFAWNRGKLEATIPPGRFASICSLQQGSYTYLASRRQTVGVRAAGRAGGLPEKGQITVK